MSVMLALGTGAVNSTVESYTFQTRRGTANAYDWRLARSWKWRNHNGCRFHGLERSFGLLKFGESIVTTLPLSIGFIFNGGSSKWRCVAAA
jgi:hypothetical protein